MNNPKVFISYDYDSQEHADRVLALANRLRAEGIDCSLDQYESSPPEGWPRWMDRQIREASWVLMVCTPTYLRRIMGDEPHGIGLGVKWEGHLVYQHLYNAGLINTKFIPIYFSDGSIKDIPTPLQSATYYRVDNEIEYDKLYWRMRGVPKISKPVLGDLRALPTKERKTDVGIFLTGFIDVDLWDKARWIGCAFIHDQSQREPPTLGLMFKDEPTACKIFEQWHKRLGHTDSFNEMRISMVEGEIPGEPSGYSVHIGANIQNILKRADCEGLNIPKDKFIVISRLHRMNPSKESKHLQIFKQRYAEFGSYYLLPVIINADEPKIFDSLRLHKKEIEFRNVRDITSKNDPDSVLIPSFIDKID